MLVQGCHPSPSQKLWKSSFISHSFANESVWSTGEGIRNEMLRGLRVQIQGLKHPFPAITSLLLFALSGGQYGK